MDNPTYRPPNILGARSVASEDGDRVTRQDSDTGYTTDLICEAEIGSTFVAGSSELSAAARWFLETRPDAAEEVQMKVKNRKSLGRILLKGDNITLVQQVGGGATD